MAESRYTSMTLGQYPKAMVRVVCSRCDRKGQYRKKGRLLICTAPTWTMPDLRHLIAKCERHGQL
jgi:hypothetical protein